MKISNDREFSMGSQGSVVTVGNFDGVHLGHRKTIGCAVERASVLKIPSVAVTFFPHPMLVLLPKKELEYLTTPSEKHAIMSELAIDTTWEIPFEPALAALEPEAFFRQYLLEKLAAREIVLGTNHRFGRQGRGTGDTMRRLCADAGVTYREVGPVEVSGVAISSTMIRERIRKGDLQKVREMLGRPYMVSGKVVKGWGYGRKLGFPTINVQPELPEKLLPGDGVYEAEVRVGKQAWKGAMYVGPRRSLGGSERVLEVHLLNFDGDLYAAEVLIYALSKIRDDRVFDGPELLARQIQDDLTQITRTEIASN